jgi:hypothetical protein
VEGWHAPDVRGTGSAGADESDFGFEATRPLGAGGGVGEIEAFLQLRPGEAGFCVAKFFLNGISKFCVSHAQTSEWFGDVAAALKRGRDVKWIQTAGSGGVRTMRTGEC